MKYCPNCGYKLPPNAAFCPSCGFQIKKTAVAAAATVKNPFIDDDEEDEIQSLDFEVQPIRMDEIMIAKKINGKALIENASFLPENSSKEKHTKVTFSMK